jgi:hypothetical protein
MRVRKGRTHFGKGSDARHGVGRESAKGSDARRQRGRMHVGKGVGSTSAKGSDAGGSHLTSSRAKLQKKFQNFSRIFFFRQVGCSRNANRRMRVRGGVGGTRRQRGSDARRQRSDASRHGVGRESAKGRTRVVHRTWGLVGSGWLTRTQTRTQTRKPRKRFQIFSRIFFRQVGCSRADRRMRVRKGRTRVGTE